MTSAGVTLEDITQWMRERFEEVVGEGGLSLVGVVRYQSNGQEQALQHHSSKEPADKWNPDFVATHLENIASRDARGLGGVVQYQIVACFGTSTKPTRFLPFQRVGALAHGPLPNGGLATEASTPTGIMDTGRRWGELAVQQAHAMSMHAFSMLSSENKSLRELSAIQFAEIREAWVALRTMAIAGANADADRVMKAAMARRSFMIQREMARMLPGALNAFAGGDNPIFPTDVGDASMFRTMARHFSEEQLRFMAAAAEKKEPGAQGFVAAVVARASAIKKDEADEDAKLRKLEEEELGIVDEGAISDPKKALQAAADAMDAAARDAAGLPPLDRQLRPKTNGTNGHANGHGTNGNGHATAVTVEASPASDAAATVEAPASDEDTALFDQFFSEAGDGAMDVVITGMRAKNPALAEKLAARYAAFKAEKGAKDDE